MASERQTKDRSLLDFLIALRKLQKKLDTEEQNEDTWWAKFCAVLDNLGPNCGWVEVAAQQVGPAFCMEELVVLLQEAGALPKGSPDESR